MYRLPPVSGNHKRSRAERDTDKRRQLIQSAQIMGFDEERLRKLREISANQIKKVNKDVHGIDPDSYEVVWEEDHKILLDLRDDEQVKWNNRNEDRDYE